MKLDRAIADVQHTRDFLIGETPEEELRDFAFPFGQERRNRGGAPTGFSAHPLPHDRCRKPKPPIGDGTDRARQFFLISIEGNDTPNTAEEPLETMILVTCWAEDQSAHRRPFQSAEAHCRLKMTGFPIKYADLNASSVCGNAEVFFGAKQLRVLYSGNGMRCEDAECNGGLFQG